VKRLAAMQPYERQIIREALIAVDDEAAGGTVTRDEGRSRLVTDDVAGSGSGHVESGEARATSFLTSGPSRHP